MVQKDDVDAQSVAIVGVFGAIVTFVLICGIQVLFYRMEKRDQQVKYVRPGSEELKDMVQEQLTGLSGYHWVDRGSDTVSIPVDRAMELVTRRYATEAPR